MIEASSVPPRKSSESVRKMFGNVRQAIGTILENLRKVVGNLAENRQKLVGLYNKQNITCSLVDMNFILSCSTRYLTRSLRSRVEHSKIKFISTRRHVISSSEAMQNVSCCSK